MLPLETQPDIDCSPRGSSDVITTTTLILGRKSNKLQKGASIDVPQDL